ncbi:sortase domain-bontaining protein [Streptomyces sp. NPDC088762]|uniref:class E sortase n=1 Tax=Streptomyces sp. NPDC088762 TaxID=3365891 RepID=UPI00382952E8
MLSQRTVPTVLASLLTLALAGCSTVADAASGEARPTAASAVPSSADVASLPTAPTPTVAASTASPSAVATSSPESPESPSSARTQPATLAIPRIGLEGLSLVPYEGTTDDRPGTRVQDQGLAASPYGARGGVGPGQIGNYLITAHRLSAGGPLRDLPSLGVGDSVFVTEGGAVYEYRITGTRKTSFRSERSLTEQRAAVPGEPGVKPTKAMITISTCATPEDNAAGNFWRDDRGNPEHRIDKIGVLASTKPAAGA